MSIWNPCSHWCRDKEGSASREREYCYVSGRQRVVDVASVAEQLKLLRDAGVLKKETPSDSPQSETRIDPTLFAPSFAPPEKQTVGNERRIDPGIELLRVKLIQQRIRYESVRMTQFEREQYELLRKQYEELTGEKDLAYPRVRSTEKKRDSESLTHSPSVLSSQSAPQSPSQSLTQYSSQATSQATLQATSQATLQATSQATSQTTLQPPPQATKQPQRRVYTAIYNDPVYYYPFQEYRSIYAKP